MEDCGHTSAWAGPAVERTKSNGKRIFATAFKRWIVEEARRPGASIAGLAMQHGVNANQLHRWMRLPQWREDGVRSAAVLLPVSIDVGPTPIASSPVTTATPVPVSPATPIEIELGGGTVRVMPGVNAALLRTVLAALRG